MIYTPENTSEIGKPMRVFVDGVEVPRCEMADTDRGYAIAITVGADGLAIFDEKGDIATERLEGIVTVEPV